MVMPSSIKPEKVRTRDTSQSLRSGSRSASHQRNIPSIKLWNRIVRTSLRRYAY